MIVHLVHVEQSPSWDTASRSACYEIIRLLWNIKIHCCHISCFYGDECEAVCLLGGFTVYSGRTIDALEELTASIIRVAESVWMQVNVHHTTQCIIIFFFFSLLLCQKRPATGPVQSHVDPVHILTPHLSKTHFNIIHLQLGFLNISYFQVFRIVLYKCFISRTSKPISNLKSLVQLGDHELASGDWREGEVLFPL
jgi:hypothetical protein